MSENQSPPTRLSGMRKGLILLFALLGALSFAFIVGIIFFGSQDWDQHNHSGGHSKEVTISAAELEQQYGIKVTLIGVTAGGGMVDFRFKIVDVEKAKALLDHHDNMPQLIPAGGQTRLGIPGAHSPSYITGKVYYMLFGNAGGIVKRGTPVEVAFGDLILEPVAAR